MLKQFVRTVVVSLCGFTLHDVLPQKLGYLVGTRNLLLQLLAASLEVTVALEVFADFNARGGQDICIAYNRPGQMVLMDSGGFSVPWKAMRADRNRFLYATRAISRDMELSREVRSEPQEERRIVNLRKENVTLDPAPIARASFL